MQALLNTLRLTQADLSRATGMGRSTTSRLVAHGTWPARSAGLGKRADDVRARVLAWLAAQGATPEQLDAVPALPQNELAPKKLKT